MEIEYLQPFQLLKICVSIQTSRHWKPKKTHSEIVNKINMLTLLPDKILHHLIGWLSHYWLLTAVFYYPNWCRVYSISRITACITARPTENLPSGKDCVLKCLGECGESCSKKMMMTTITMMMMMMMHSRRSGPGGDGESFVGLSPSGGVAYFFDGYHIMICANQRAEIARR